ncbi:hypothetical protein MKZ38_007930 [Zalerion maritima]|uniref:Suppressor of anucleate metulae protein B n=1 Tax=Zalerion maritima TaxID=339359 RepID=A0AAD5WNV9_9PEZI|nr:hypothetical protein MKZ38_007930 [Zalerion maritima]
MSNLDEMFAFQDVPGKGKGLVAIRKIPKGTRILSEKPLIALCKLQSVATQKTSLIKQVEALPPSARQGFLSRPNIYGAGQELADKYFGIFRTIGLPCGDDDDEVGYFPHACSINHACDNNVQKSWNKKIKRHTVHALREIKAGEEITVYYLAIHNNRRARQEALQRKFGFTCACRLCMLPAEESRRNDTRLDRILELDDLIGRGGTQALVSRPQQVLSYVDEQVRLYNEGGANDSGLARANFDAAQVCVANGDLARARFFCQRAADEAALCSGGDGTMVELYRRMAIDPSKHPQGIANMTRAWKTAIADVPQGLSDQEFDNWLWRRPQPSSQPLKTGSSRQPADLRNRTFFPSFASLPRDWDVNDLLEPGVRQRHWCFLGEIVGDASVLPIRLTVLAKDVDGHEFELAFYTDERGAEVDPALGSTAVGSAVAILYAEYHRFAFSPPGIRHEYPSRFKASHPPFSRSFSFQFFWFCFRFILLASSLVFPMSLEKLLSLSDLVQQFSWAKDGHSKTCHGCGQLGQSLKKCSKCGLMWYCNSKCQKHGWHKMGHKEDCKLLRDSDLKGMFNLRWDEFDKFVEFPLAEVS